MSDDAQQEILYDVRGQCVVITINRPAQRNAMNIAACHQLTEAFRRFEEDSGLRVAILTGAGDQAFSAGRDVKETAGLHGAAVPPLPLLGVNIEVSKPVIAAVNGVALGGGWVFAQMCDLCIAADTAKFAITAGARHGGGNHRVRTVVGGGGAANGQACDEHGRRCGGQGRKTTERPAVPQRRRQGGNPCLQGKAQARMERSLA